VLEFGIPILVFKLKLAKKDVKCVSSTVIITTVTYTLIHFINILLNNYCIKNNILNYEGDIVKVNYMYSLYPENPVLDFFYKIIPSSYWYMLLCIPIIILYLLAVYFIDFSKKKSNP